jgi:transposase
VRRAGRRLLRLKRQAARGQVVLLFEDESEALTYPYLGHAWAPAGSDLRIQAPGRVEKCVLLGVRNAVSQQLIVTTSATKRSGDFIQLLEQVEQRYRGGPVSGKVILVLDNGSIHTSKASRQALAERPWLQVEWLPLYAPELNEIERDWLHLKQHYLANQTFHDVGELSALVHIAIQQINRSRIIQPCADLT